MRTFFQFSKITLSVLDLGEQETDSQNHCIPLPSCNENENLSIQKSYQQCEPLTAQYIDDGEVALNGVLSQIFGEVFASDKL